MERDLEIEEDVPFQQRTWRVERVGWTFMTLLILAALVGLLGPGNLSKTVHWDLTSKVKAEFNRFERYQAQAVLRLQIDSSVISAEQLSVTLNRQFIDEVELKHIDPEPERVETEGEQFNFHFAVSSNRPAHIVFHYEPDRYGRMPIEVRVGDNVKLNFKQFYFP